MRQRVVAALASSVGKGRSKNSGRPQSLAASCSFWLVLRSSRSIMAATAAGAPECSASAMAHKVSLRCAVSTRMTLAGSQPKALRPCPHRRPWRRSISAGRTKTILPRLILCCCGGEPGRPPGTRQRGAAGEIKRATIATTKPRAAGMALAVSGTISCKPPQARPPSGKWESIPVKSNGSDSWPRGGDANRRRSSSTTAARRDSAENVDDSIIWW